MFHTCAWVALLEDNETGALSQYRFRYYAFADNDEVMAELAKVLSRAFIIIEVSTNPYKFKDII